MPPTYLFGIPHIYDKQRGVTSLTGLSDGALKILRLTSLGFICSGLYLLSMSSALYMNKQPYSVRGSLNATDVAWLVHKGPRRIIDSLANIGACSIAVGISSTFNYIFYTGIPNIFSCIDFVCVIVCGLFFVLENHRLAEAGHTPMVILHIWCFLTACTYVGRKSPSDQILVHIMGLCGIILWYVLLNKNFIFSN